MPVKRMVNGRQVTIIAPFRPEKWQLPPLQDRSLTVLLTGSAGGGKSRIAAEKVHLYCLKFPGSTALALRKTSESTRNSIVTFLENVVIGPDPRVRKLSSLRRFEYDNGSMLVWGGMKNQEQRESLRSVGQAGSVDIVWMEEATAFAEADYDELLARMRGKAGTFRQIILTTNPGPPAHWIHQRLMQEGEAQVYYSSALDNPANPPEYLSVLQKLRGVLYQRLVEGKWVQAEGAVFADFDPLVGGLHVFGQAPDLKRFKRFLVGVDWGFTNPGVMTVWGVDGDVRLTLVEEVYRTQELVAGVDGKDGFWVNTARRLNLKYKKPKFLCDPSEPAYITTLQRSGVNAVPANNDLRAGIDRIQSRLRVAYDGLPRILFYAYANPAPDPALERSKADTGLLDELAAYVYARSQDGKPNKEIPMDEHNHSIDTCRYVVNDVDAGAEVRITRL